MKNLFITVLLSLMIIATLGLVGTIDKQSEELIMLKQLHNVQREMLEDNFSQKELDSMYYDYKYYYLKNYYENNY